MHGRKVLFRFKTNFGNMEVFFGVATLILMLTSGKRILEKLITFFTIISIKQSFYVIVFIG